MKMRMYITSMLSIMLLTTASINASETSSASGSQTASGTGTASTAATAGTSAGAIGAGVANVVAGEMAKAFGVQKNPVSSLTGGVAGGVSAPGGVAVQVGDVTLSILDKTIAEAKNNVACATAEAKGEGKQSGATSTAVVQNVEVAAGASNVVVGAITCTDISQESTATTTKTTSKGEKGKTASMGKAGVTQKRISASRLGKQQNLGVVETQQAVAIPLKKGFSAFSFYPANPQLRKAQGKTVRVASEVVPFTRAIAADENLTWKPNQHVLLVWARVESPYKRSGNNPDLWPWKEVIAIPFANSMLGRFVPAMAWSNGNITLRLNNGNATSTLDEYFYIQAEVTE